MAKSNRVKIRNPQGVTDFSANSYRAGTIGGKSIYPLANRIGQGYGVNHPQSNPSTNQWNGRMINVRGEKIDFWIEEIESDFEVAGTTAQSQKLRQFFPHNMVQVPMTVRGRAPNSMQFNRLASFVRVSQYASVSVPEIRSEGGVLRSFKENGITQVIPTIRLILRNGRNGKGYPYNGRTVKGVHNAWKLEGYIKSMGAGGQRFDPAPAFEFEFLVAESALGGGVGLWEDTLVTGSQLKPWLDIFNNSNRKGYVPGETPNDKGVNDKGINGEDITPPGTGWIVGDSSTDDITDPLGNSPLFP